MATAFSLTIIEGKRKLAKCHILQLLTESLELITLRHLGFVVREGATDLVLVYDDAVIVDLTKTVGLLQIVPADFIVKRDMVPLAKSTDPHVDVVDSGIVMDENDVVVEDENIDNEHRELHQEGHEEADET